MEKFSAIADNITRIKKIIEHVRLFSRNQQDTQVKFDVVKTIKDALSMINVQCQQHQIKIVEEIEPDTVKTMGNRYRLEQVLINLLSNAKPNFTTWRLKKINIYVIMKSGFQKHLFLTRSQVPLCIYTFDYDVIFAKWPM